MISKTTMAQANSTGNVVIVLAQPPQSTAASGSFEIANFNLGVVTTSSNASASLNFNSGDMQVVTSSKVPMTVMVTSATLSLNPVYTTSTPTPTAATGVTNTPTPRPSNTPTSTPLSTSTPTPTTSQTVSVYLNLATGKTCSTYCGDQGKTCIDVGSDPSGTNNEIVTYNKSTSYCQTPATGTCSTQMVDQSHSCFGYAANWTYCRCQ